MRFRSLLDFQSLLQVPVRLLEAAEFELLLFGLVLVFFNVIFYLVG